MASKEENEEILRLMKEIDEMTQSSLSENLKLNAAKKRQQQTVKNLVSLEQELLEKMREKENLSDEEVKDYREQISLARQQINAQQKILDIEKQRVNILGQMVNKMNQLGASPFFQYLMESDGAVKGLNLELGLSGERAAHMRDNIEGAATSAARLGASVQDLANIQSTFANETGRARATSADLLENVVLIGKGTGLGVDNAARMVGQFELMGLTAQQSMNYVQGVVESSELMGVNTAKVLKNISGNFKELQKFTFRQGVQGFAEMAEYAEKFNVDMGSMLDSAEKARTLEGAVDLAAQLQVMGGEFAKSDPFELLFLSRNDPAKYTEKINQMTKGVATFKKNAEGGFETFISPMDMDRLERVGSALGMQRGELAEQAKRMAEIRRMRQQMIGLDREQMDIVEGVAKRESNSLKYYVEVAGKRKMLNQLTNEDISSLKKQNVALEERAKNAKTFDEEFANTLNMFKSSMLPILDGINYVLENAIQPAISGIESLLNTIPSEIKPLLTGVGVAIAGAVGLGKILTPLIGIFKGGGMLGGLMKGGGLGGGSVAKAAGGGKGGGLGGMLGAGAGVGLAGAGIGAGIGAAAAGISTLADSMAKLDEDQLKTLQGITNTLGIVAGVGAAAAIGIAAFGSGAAVAAPGILAVGGAVALIGVGIGAAAAGIGYLAKNMKELDGDEMMKASMGIGMIAGSTLMLANPMTLVGVAALAGSLAAINYAADGDGIKNLAVAFDSISTVLQGSSSQFKEIRDTINAINNMETDGDSAFASLANLLNKPLKVEFADKDVSLNTSVTLNVDGNRLAESLNLSQRVAVKYNEQKTGKSGGGTT